MRYFDFLLVGMAALAIYMILLDPADKSGGRGR